MCSGAARKLHKSNKLPVVIVGGDGRPRWSDLWNGLPYILPRARGQVVNRLVSGAGVRAYIAKKTPERWVWKPYKPIPAEIVFTKAEIAFAEPFRGMVMIEPNVKNIGHTNKEWLYDRWIAVSREIAWDGTGVVQCVPGPARSLLIAKQVVTPTFRHAAAVLSVAKAFVGTEGGLGHAAAAVDTPAVILFSEFIGPENVGYDSPKIINLRHAGKPCGMRTNCPGCRKSMEAITVDEVVESLERLLK